MHTRFGFTLIEVLISLFILSLLLLGVDTMQLAALRETKNSYAFNVATQQLNVMQEQLRINKGNNMDQIMQEWNQENKLVLPSGRGMITGEYPIFDLTIFWGEDSASNCSKNKIGSSGCIHVKIQY